MAKSEKKKINKSQAVREELARSDTGSPSEIVSTLASKGVKVSAAFVSNIKSQEKKRHGGIDVGFEVASQILSHTANKKPVSEGELLAASSLIMKAVDLVVEAGPQRARSLLSLAEKLVTKVTNKK